MSIEKKSSKEEIIKKTEYTDFHIIKVFLKVLAWCALVLGIVFSFFYAPTNLFSMVAFIFLVIILFAILYALAVIIKLLVDLHSEIVSKKAKLSE